MMPRSIITDPRIPLKDVISETINKKPICTQLNSFSAEKEHPICPFVALHYIRLGTEQPFGEKLFI